MPHKPLYPFRPEALAKQHQAPLARLSLPPDLARMKDDPAGNKPHRGHEFSEKVANICSCIAIVCILASFAIIMMAKGQHSTSLKGGDVHDFGSHINVPPRGK